MNLRHTVFVGGIVVVLLTLALVLIPAPERSEPEDISYQEETEQLQLIVEYSTFGYEAADESLRSLVDTFVADFRNTVSDFDASVASRPYVLVIEDQEKAETFDTVGTRLLVYQDFGGAHGLPQLIGLNFYKESGEEVALSDVLVRIGMDLEELSLSAHDHFEAELGESFFVSGTEPKEENFSSFLIRPNTVTFYFQPYQVAAYALGPQEYTIAY